jgi:hypothetical protein
MELLVPIVRRLQFPKIEFDVKVSGLERLGEFLNKGL